MKNSLLFLSGLMGMVAGQGFDIMNGDWSQAPKKYSESTPEQNQAHLDAAEKKRARKAEKLQKHTERKKQ